MGCLTGEMTLCPRVEADGTKISNTVTLKIESGYTRAEIPAVSFTVEHVCIWKVNYQTVLTFDDNGGMVFDDESVVTI